MTGSANLDLTLGAVSLWVGAMFGTEYRAASLAQYSIINAEDRIAWSAWAGARLNISGHWSFVANYTWMMLRTPDAISRGLHALGVAVVYVL